MLESSGERVYLGSPRTAWGHLICSHSVPIRPGETMGDPVVDLFSGRSTDWADAIQELATSPPSAQPGW